MRPTDTQQKEWATPEVKLLDQAEDAENGAAGAVDGNSSS